MPDAMKFFLTLVGVLAVFGAGALFAIFAETRWWGLRIGGHVPFRGDSIREAYLENTSDTGLAAPVTPELRAAAKFAFRTASENAMAEATATPAPTLHMAPFHDLRLGCPGIPFSERIHYHFDQQLHDPEGDDGEAR